MHRGRNGLQAALDDQKKKMEGDMARHLAFIDRLLADKDKLSAKCVQLGKDIKVTGHCAGFAGRGAGGGRGSGTSG